MPSPGATFGPPPRREAQDFWTGLGGIGFFLSPSMGYIFKWLGKMGK